MFDQYKSRAFSAVGELLNSWSSYPANMESTWLIPANRSTIHFPFLSRWQSVQWPDYFYWKSGKWLAHFRCHVLLGILFSVSCIGFLVKCLYHCWVSLTSEFIVVVFSPKRILVASVFGNKSPTKIIVHSTLPLSLQKVEELV